jgi:hypothetical protein
LPLQGSGASEHLLVHPPEEGSIELYQLLTGHVREDGPALTFVHQIPHRRDSGFAPALVGCLSIVGHKVKFASAVAETALLDLMVAHGKLTE